MKLKIKPIRIKQQKNILERAVYSAFGALIIVFGLYIYQNVSIVFNMIDYKNSVNKVASLEKQILNISDQTVEYKKALAINAGDAQNLRKIESNNFIARKDVSSGLSMLYAR